MGRNHDNLSWGWCWRGALSFLFSFICWTSSTKRYDIKALPHQDWKEHIVIFLCLQAVNYLTSTHNEQCKTSQNLIKRQRPGLDGKWLTQLIKHPSVRLNMASPSHHLRKKMGAVVHYHFSISFSPWSIYYIYYVDPCLFCCSHKDIYVHVQLLPDSFPLSWWDRDVDNSEATKMPSNPGGIYAKVVWFLPLGALLLRGLLTKRPQRVDKQVSVENPIRQPGQRERCVQNCTYLETLVSDL